MVFLKRDAIVIAWRGGVRLKNAESHTEKFVRTVN
jgi:hypothetical protein